MAARISGVSARALTGSDYALVRSHILRNPQQARVHDDLAPIRFVHSDFAPSYGGLMREFYAGDSEEARESLAMEGVTAVEVANAKRLVILQRLLWLVMQLVLI